MTQLKIFLKAFLEGYAKFTLTFLLWLASLLGGKFKDTFTYFIQLFYGPRPKVKDLLFVIKITPDGDTFVGKNHMTTIVRVDQGVEVTLSLKDDYGNDVGVTGIDGQPVWSVSDESIATVTASEDGLTAKIVPTGALGTVQVNVMIDADPGVGQEELIGILDLTAVSGKARIISLTPTLFDKQPQGGGEPEVPETPEQPVDPVEPPAPVEPPVEPEPQP